MKKLSMLLCVIFLVGLLAGCAGTPVIYYTDCTCPAGTVHDTPQATNPPVAEGQWKTGLAIAANNKDSVNGEVKYDVTVVAVTVDGNGIIQACAIDSIGASVTFDATGAITSDITAPVQTKNELGDSYGMVAYGGAVAEWYRQADALAKAVVGHKAGDITGTLVSESGKAVEGTDLASAATIYLGGYVAAIEKAAANAKALGAQAGDQLKLAIVPTLASSTGATGENAGNAQLDVDVAALTVKDGTVTSCYIDSLQAKTGFDATGTLTAEAGTGFATKNELGADYGMVAWGNAIAEWDQQAAAFAAYVTGKTAAEVAGIAVNEKTAPAEADLAASVTIAIGGFQKLIAKAFQ